MNEENELPRGWITAKVNELAEVVEPGFPYGRYNTIGLGFPQMRPMNIDGQGRLCLDEVKYVDVANPPLLERNDILFNNTNSPVWVGKTTVIPEGGKFTFSNHMTRVRLNPISGLPTFFALQLHYLQQFGYFQARCNHHVNQASISSSYLSSSVDLLVAPLPEQQRIVAAIEQQFSRLDAGVAALRRAQAKLKRYRAAVLKAAVEGKLTEAWRAEHPTTEPAAQLLERILTERRAKWEAELRAKGKDPAKVRYVEATKPDTGSLSELPEGWCWGTVEQISSLQRGRFSVRPRNDPRYYGGSYPFVQIGDLPEDGGDIVTFKQTLNVEGYKVSREFPIGTVLVSIAASIGGTGILTFRSCFPDSLVGIIGQDISTAKYLEIFLRTKRQELKAQSYASGGQPNISLPILQRLPMPLPPLAEQEQIVAEVERRLSVISQLEATVEANLKRAERLRQSILKEAFAGRLVPQDPSDEPASVLLERIRGERDKRKHGALDKGREVICEIPRPKKIDVRRTKQVELWEGVER